MSHILSTQESYNLIKQANLFSYLANHFCPLAKVLSIKIDDEDFVLSFSWWTKLKIRWHLCKKINSI